MNELIPADNKEISKPQDILFYLQASLDTLVFKYLYVAEEAIQNKMRDFVLSFKDSIPSVHEDVNNLSFNLEVQQNKLRIIPHNLYSLLVKEGIVLPYSQVSNINRIEHDNRIFVFNPIEKEPIVVKLDS